MTKVPFFAAFKTVGFDAKALAIKRLPAEEVTINCFNFSGLPSDLRFFEYYKLNLLAQL